MSRSYILLMISRGSRTTHGTLDSAPLALTKGEGRNHAATGGDRSAAKGEEPQNGCGASDRPEAVLPFRGFYSGQTPEICSGTSQQR